MSTSAPPERRKPGGGRSRSKSLISKKKKLRKNKHLSIDSDDSKNASCVSIQKSKSRNETRASRRKHNKSDSKNKIKIVRSGTNPVEMRVGTSSSEDEYKRKKKREIITADEFDDMFDDLIETRTRGAAFRGVTGSDRAFGIERENDISAPLNSSSFKLTDEDEHPEYDGVISCSIFLNFGFADTRGRRSSMEDAVLLFGQVNDIDHIDVFGIFDGHGGSQVSKFSQEILPGLLQEKLSEGMDPENVLLEVFQEVNQMIFERRLSGGSTALIGLRFENIIHIANLGDCRAVLCKNQTGERITRDHTPALEQEKKRIIKNGGTIIESITRDGLLIQRINGQLALSRCLGDIHFSEYLSDEPDLFQIELQTNEYLILACDGLWDVVKDDEVAQISAQFIQNGELKEAAERLRDIAYHRGSSDNISVLVITSKEALT